MLQTIPDNIMSNNKTVVYYKMLPTAFLRFIKLIKKRIMKYKLVKASHIEFQQNPQKALWDM
jgi:hypothetical protein